MACSTRDLFFVQTSSDLFVLFVLTCEKKIRPKQSCLVLSFDFERHGIDRDTITVRRLLIKRMRSLGFKISRATSLYNRLSMVYWVYEYKHQSKGRFRNFFYRLVQWAKAIDTKQMVLWKDFDRFFVSHPSHPLSQLLIERKRPNQEVHMYPHGLGYKPEEMKKSADFYNMPYLMNGSKQPLWDFYKSEVISKLKLSNEIDLWPNNSVMVCVEYIETIVRTKEFIDLYAQLLIRLYDLGFASFIVKFHPRSCRSDNIYFLNELRSRLKETPVCITELKTCLDTSLWANPLAQNFPSKLSAVSSVVSSAPLMIAEDANIKAIYCRALMESLFKLNPPADNSLPLYPKEANNVLLL